MLVPELFRVLSRVGLGVDRSRLEIALRDLLYSFWREAVTDQSSFTKQLPEGAGCVDVDAGWHQGTKDIHIAITFKCGWRRGRTDGFTITPTIEFR